jgi:hypothetical protein
MGKTIATVGRPQRAAIDHLVWVQPGAVLRPTGAGSTRVLLARQRGTVIATTGSRATVAINGRWYTTSVYALAPRRS